MTLAKHKINKRPLPPARMVTCNRAQMAAAIKAVEFGEKTVIEAIDNKNKVLVRYTFPKRDHGLRRDFEKHIRKLSRAVMKTPAVAWR